MLNKELLLCGSSGINYPPRLDRYDQARTVILTACNLGGGVDGIDFQFKGTTPSRVEDSSGRVDIFNTFIWYLALAGEISSTNTYPVYVASFTFPYSPPTNPIKIRYSIAGGGIGEETNFYIGACIPVYNCGRCEVLKSDDAVMEFMFTISDPTKTCHIHLENRV